MISGTVRRVLDYASALYPEQVTRIGERLRVVLYPGTALFSYGLTVAE